MSDFLFRMVERAAGLGRVPVTQPHNPFPGLLSVESLPENTAPLDDLAGSTTAPATAFLLRGRAPVVDFVTPSRSSLVQDTERGVVNNASTWNPVDTVAETRAPQGWEPPASKPSPAFIPQAEGDNVFADRPSGWPFEGARQEPQKPVELNAAREISRSHSDLAPQGSESGFSHAAKRTLNVANTAAASEPRVPLQDSLPAFQRDSLPVLQEVAEDTVLSSSEPSKSLVSARTLPTNITSTTKRRPPSPVAPLVESKQRAAPATALKEAPEPSVEVKIGRVEIRFEAPAPVAQAAPSQPRGFSEYTALRTYAARPGFSGNR